MRSPERPYSLGEEIAHSVTHSLGIVASIAGLVVLVAFASLRGDAPHVVGCSVFGASLVLLYTASTLLVWHLFVLAGSVMHYFAVLLYVVPRAG